MRGELPPMTRTPPQMKTALALLVLLLVLTGCSQSVEIRASGTHSVDGEPVTWTARYCAGG